MFRRREEKKDPYLFLDMRAKRTSMIIDKRAPTIPDINHGDAKTFKIEGGVTCINLLETNQLKMK